MRPRPQKDLKKEKMALIEKIMSVYFGNLKTNKQLVLLENQQEQMQKDHKKDTPKGKLAWN